MSLKERFLSVIHNARLSNESAYNSVSPQDSNAEETRLEQEVLDREFEETAEKLDIDAGVEALKEVFGGIECRVERDVVDDGDRLCE